MSLLILRDMKEILVTLGIFSLFVVGIIALAIKWVFGLTLNKIKSDSLTPEDILELRAAADELVKRINEAADNAISRIENREARLRELLSFTDSVILSPEAVNAMDANKGINENLENT